MEYTGKLDNMSDEELMAQIMRTGGEPHQPMAQRQKHSPEDLLAVVVEGQQKAAEANYHLRMLEAGAIIDEKTGKINPDTIEPVIADFAAQEYIANMTKIAAQREKVLNGFNLIQGEKSLTVNDKLMVKQQLIDKGSWPVHISSLKPPAKQDPAQVQKKSEAEYSGLLDTLSMYQENVKAPMKGINKVVPLALLDTKGKVAREATPFELSQYLHTKERLEKHPIHQTFQKFSALPKAEGKVEDVEKIEEAYTREDVLKEYKNLGGSTSAAGRKFAEKFLSEK